MKLEEKCTFLFYCALYAILKNEILAKVLDVCPDLFYRFAEDKLQYPKYQLSMFQTLGTFEKKTLCIWSMFMFISVCIFEYICVWPIHEGFAHYTVFITKEIIYF